MKAVEQRSRIKMERIVVYMRVLYDEGLVELGLLIQLMSCDFEFLQIEIKEVEGFYIRCC